MTGSRNVWVMFAALAALAACSAKERETVDGAGGSGGATGGSGGQTCTMSTPAPLASPCTSDPPCLAHRCNLAVGKCAWPCATDCDCAAGNKCVSQACVPVASGCGQLKDDPGVADLVSSKLTQLAASGVVAGAFPTGAMIVDDFTEGKILENQLQLQPGKCYTVVAVGLPQVTEVNVRFVAVTPIPDGGTIILAQDQDTGAQAVLGKKPNCYKSPAPFALPVNLVLEVTAGCGVAGAQVYEK